jgi:hypothetical protein
MAANLTGASPDVLAYYGISDVSEIENHFVAGTSFITVSNTISEGFQVVPTDETIEYSKEVRGDD